MPVVYHICYNPGYPQLSNSFRPQLTDLTAELRTPGIKYSNKRADRDGHAHRPDWEAGGKCILKP